MNSKYKFSPLLNPFWLHFYTCWPRRLINGMFELNIYLFSESQFSAIIVIIGSISMNNSFQLKINNLSFLESVSYLVRPHLAPIDLDSIRISSFDCTTNLTAPSSVFQLGNRKPQLLNSFSQLSLYWVNHPKCAVRKP